MCTASGLRPISNHLHSWRQSESLRIHVQVVLFVCLVYRLVLFTLVCTENQGPSCRPSRKRGLTFYRRLPAAGPLLSDGSSSLSCCCHRKGVALRPGAADLSCVIKTALCSFFTLGIRGANWTSHTAAWPLLRGHRLCHATPFRGFVTEVSNLNITP